MCQQCKSGYFGSDCMGYGCPSSCLVCSGTNTCSICKDGSYGPNCAYSCMSSCQTCQNNQTCTTCKNGWQGSTCQLPIFLQNCKSCNNTTSCTSCVDGFRGDQCFSSCPSTCVSCNATSCTKCLDGYYGAQCENKEVRCDQTMGLYPNMNTRVMEY